MTVLRKNMGPLNITAAAAVAVCRAISEVCGAECSIKWVNDVYLSGKKICGILTEAQASAGSGMIDSIVVGIGINCIGMEEEFPAELRERAASLACAAEADRAVSGLSGNRAAVDAAKTEGGGSRAGETADGSRGAATIDRNKLAAAVACELLRCAYGDGGNYADEACYGDSYSGEACRINAETGAGQSREERNTLTEEYRRRSMLIGEEIYIFRNACGGKGAGLDENGQPLIGIPAKAIGISDEGGLIVLYDDGEKDVLADGEVSVRIRM